MRKEELKWKKVINLYPIKSTQTIRYYFMGQSNLGLKVLRNQDLIQGISIKLDIMVKELILLKTLSKVMVIPHKMLTV